MKPASSVLSLLVLTTVVTAALGLPSAEANPPAKSCASRDGVTVMVEFNGLGPDDEMLCELSGQRRTAADLFVDGGLTLGYTQRQPGFVCRVSGVPEQDPCVNTPPGDAYWSLWWSDGTSARWSYATTGAGSLRIPGGGGVALVWDGTDGVVTPRAAPPGAGGQPRASSDAAVPTADPSDPAGGGLPAWVAPIGIATLFAAAAATAVVRRRRGTTGA